MKGGGADNKGSLRRKKKHFNWNDQLIWRLFLSRWKKAGEEIKRRSEKRVVSGRGVERAEDIYIYKTAKDKTCTVHRLSMFD